MNLTKAIENIFQRYLPSPFTIAILLSLLTLLLAVFFTRPSDISLIDYTFDVFRFWENGIWSNSLLVFAYQMMLILILGHVLVLSKPVSKAILKITQFCKDTSTSAAIVASTTMLVAFFN